MSETELNLSMNPRENIMINAEVMIDDTIVVSLGANIQSSEANNMNYTTSILNHELYVEHLEEIRKEIQKFKETIRAREDYLFDIYHKKEEPEEPIEDPEEPIEEPEEDAPIEEPTDEE